MEFLLFLFYIFSWKCLFFFLFSGIDLECLILNCTNSFPQNKQKQKQNSPEIDRVHTTPCVLNSKNSKSQWTPDDPEPCEHVPAAMPHTEWPSRPDDRVIISLILT